jgi:branched-chain amino acid transport system ATP-binding protein
MLEVEGLCVRYGHKEALRGIGLRVAEGEIVTLIGSNGAGKTTALKAISGLLRPSAGTIRFRGERIDRMAPHAVIARGIVQVPEGRLLFPEMSVMEHLDLGGLRAPRDAVPFGQRTEELFALFPILAERRSQRAGTLSGGQQQMLAIGRALMAAPRFLMLDEPSLGLAPVMVDQLADAIVRLHKGGLTILLVEQRVDLALHLANRG